MKKIFYPADRHELRTDEQTGALYWAVNTKNLMFTYFEVPPNKTFEKHTHESEQMTYVLSGSLFFDVEGEIYRVGPGDLISISSFKEHSVWTEAEGAKAIDAWSPVNKKYL